MMNSKLRWRCVICGKYISNYAQEDICKDCKDVANKESEKQK